MARDANDKDGLRSAGRVFARIGVIGFAVLGLLVATTFVGGVSWQFVGNIAYYLGPVWIVFSGLYSIVATMIGDDAPKHMGSPLVFGLTAAAIGASIHLSGRWLRACPKPTST